MEQQTCILDECQGIQNKLNYITFTFNIFKYFYNVTRKSIRLYNSRVIQDFAIFYVDFQSIIAMIQDYRKCIQEMLFSNIASVLRT